MRYSVRVNGARYRLSTHTSEGIAVDIIRATDGRCVYCGERGSQIDHVVPHRRGGPNIRENKVLACGRCNAKKGQSLDLAWLTRGLYAIIRRGESTDWLKGWKDVSGDLAIGDMTGGHPWQGRD